MALDDLAKSLMFNENTVNAIRSGKKYGWHVDSHFRRKPKSPLPQQPEETKKSEWTGDASKPVTSVVQKSLALKKTEIRSSNAVLKLWSKLRPRRHTKKRLEPETRGSIASARNRRNAEKTMSARSQRGPRDSSPVKKLATPRFGGKNVGQKMPSITYDYDAAVSQPDVPNFLDSKKNGRYPMKRYQAPVTKRVIYNARSPTGKTADCTKESVASGTSNEKEEKENVGSGVVDVENLTNFLKQTTEAQNLSYKITTIEVIGKGNNDHTVENDIENEKAKENEEPVEYKNVPMSPVPPVKSSRIPRAKIVALPIQTVQEFRSGKKATASRKLKDCTNAKCPPGCDQNNSNVPEKQATTVQSDRAQDETKNEEVHFEKTVKETKIVWNDEKTSETEAEGDDRALSSTDESAPVIDGLDHPQVLSILQNLKLNCPCKTCTNQNLPSSSRPDDDSDLKSSSPEEYKKKKWPLRHRKYIDTSSEGTSSDRHDGKERRKKRSKNNTVKNPLILRQKTSSLINANPKASGRRGSNFSFFNTLFDIVFWPYVFLKSNR